MSSVKVVLPPNEQHQFVTLCGHVDQRKYDKAIKTADGILKKFPNHSETMSLKGLAEHQTGNKELGFTLAKKAMKADISSAVACHVLGVIYRNDRAFHQASKYFQMALYRDPKNEKALRDLATVQLQLRDYDAHLKSRKAIWKARPDLKGNWIAYAVACMLCGEHEFTHHLIRLVQESSLSDQDLPLDRWETQSQHSELLLFQNFILRDAIKADSPEAAQAYQAALADLESSRPRILDKILVREIEAELNLKSKKLDAAKQNFLSLIDTNPDNITYHYGLLSSLAGTDGATLDSVFTLNLDGTGKPVKGFTAQNVSSVLSADIKAELALIYADLQKKNPKSLLIQQMPLLHWLDGEAFKTSFGQYARPLLSKGVPSLWNSVKSLYKYPAHVAIINTWARDVIASLEKEKKFPGESKEEDPTTLLWAYYFLAQHECQEGAFEDALNTIEKAITHTPTVMDVYLIKGKILSKAGDALGAAEAVEKARSMDLADRNLNTLSVKYWLKASNTVKAQANMAMFAKLDLSHYSNVFTMQVLWYESHKANANLNLAPSFPSPASSKTTGDNHLALALKDFHNSIEHYHEMNEDQLDFLNYGIRYATLCSFIRILRTEDRLPGYAHFTNASKGLVKCYLRLDDNLRQLPFSPASFVYADYVFDKTEDKAVAIAAATAAAAEGATQEGGKKNKAPPPKKKAGETVTAPTTTSNKTWNSKIDSDPRGERLAKTQKPLQRAALYAQHIAAEAWEDIDTHALLVEYYTRTAQFSLALRSVTQLVALAPAHPSTLLATARLVTAWTDASSKKTASPALNAIIDAKIAKLLEGKTLEAFIDAYATAATTYSAKVAAAAAYVLIGKQDKISSLLLNVGKEVKYNVKSLLHARFLIHTYANAELTKFTAAVHAAYPLVSYFAPPKVQEEQVHEPTHE